MGRVALALIVLLLLALGVFASWRQRSAIPAADRSAAGSPALSPALDAEDDGDGTVQPLPARLSRSEEPTAVVEGSVTYRFDPDRRWRQGRYYVASSKGGPLAEAVVELRAVSAPRVERPGAGANDTTVSIDQKDYQFVPETVAIRSGDSVHFSNSDPAIHNVRTTEGSDLFNVSLSPGSEYVHRFRRAGGIASPVRLGCVFHGSMRGWIYVFDHEFFELTARDGRYRFEAVPPGEYVLAMVHPAGGLHWSRPLTVENGSVTRVDISVSPDDRVNETHDQAKNTEVVK